MSWNGRSSIPAEAGGTDAAEGPTTHEVVFAAAFDAPPEIVWPAAPDGVTVTVGEVTETGFTFTVEVDPAVDDTSVEWIATPVPSEPDPTPEETQ